MPARAPNTHIFIFACEARAVELVHGHDDGHDVFAIHDGCGQDVLCHIIGQLISKGAEVGTLGSKRGEKRGSQSVDLDHPDPGEARPKLHRVHCPG